MKTKKRLAGGAVLTVMALAAATTGAQAQVNIDIDLDARGEGVSPTLNGIFFEDINHAADGGLYAELLRNRSMEEIIEPRRRPLWEAFDDEEAWDEAWGETPEGEPRERGNDGMPPQEARGHRREAPAMAAWKAVGKATLSLTEDNLLNAQQRHALRVSIEESGAGVRNDGYWGINTVGGTQYKLSLWTRLDAGKPVALVASLRGEDGTLLASSRMEAKWKKGEWQRLETTMVATGDDPGAHFELTAEGECELALDVVSLMPPTFKNRANGLRKDLAEMLAAMRPKFVRFPGGCFVEGQRTEESAFHWRRTVGPIEERPGHMGTNWNYWTTDGLGFHEFLQMAEDFGAEPLYVVNVGIWHGGFRPVEELDTTWVQECLDALEYANGDATTPLGSLRAANGHPAPFGIKYLEVGNENANFNLHDNSDQSERYFERYRKFREAVLAKYPEMHIIGNVEAWSTDHPSWRSSEPVDILDEHYYRDPLWFVEAFDKYDDYDRQGPRIYAGEFAVTSQFGRVGNMNAALGEAVYMLGMERNSDVVIMNSYAPLLVNENAYNWPTNLIHFDTSRAFGTPSYWVQRLFSTNIGTRLLDYKCETLLPEPQTKGEESEEPLQVGVSTWGTTASFRDARVTVDGKELALPPITEWSSTQRTPEQREGGPRRVRARQVWTTDEEEGTATNTLGGEGIKWLCPTELTPAQGRHYTYEVKAKKTGGVEGFLVVYNYRNERAFDWLNVGGWGNTTNAIEQDVDGGRFTISEEEPFEVETDRWYDIRIEVEGDSAAAYIDDKLTATATHRSGNMRGVFTSATLDEGEGVLYVKVVNVGEERTTGTVNLAGGKAVAAGMERLAAEGGQEENSMEYPLNLIPRPANVDIGGEGSRLTFEVAPFSVNVIKAKVR